MKILWVISTWERLISVVSESSALIGNKEGPRCVRNDEQVSSIGSLTWRSSPVLFQPLALFLPTCSMPTERPG